MRYCVFLFLSFALVTGCMGNFSDERLRIADSLDQVPDRDHSYSNNEKAYGIVMSLNGDSMSERDNAIRTLILTHTRIKRLDSLTAADDSTINVAVDYFSSHRDDGNYYPRALLMKGCLMEKLTDINESGLEVLKLYDDALSLLNDSDRLWRGYAHLRVAELFNSNNNSDHQVTLSHYKRALDDFVSAGDFVKEAYCRWCMAGEYYMAVNDSGLVHSMKSIKISEMIGDSDMVARNCADVASYYINTGKNDEAIAYGKRALSADSVNAGENGVWAMLVNAYSRAGKLDSARVAAKRLSDMPNSALKLITLENLAEAEKDYREALVQMKYYHLFRDSTLRQEIQTTMSRSTELLENERLKVEKAELGNKMLWAVVGVFALIIILSAVLIVMQRNRLKYKQAQIDIERIKQERETYKAMWDTLNSKSNTANDKIVKIRDFVNEQLHSTDELVRDLATKPSHKGVRESVLGRTMMMKKGGVLLRLREYVNLVYDNVLEKKIDKSEHLSERDTDLICMTLCDFSMLSIQDLLGYSHDKSIFNARRRIAKRLGVDSLKDLVER